MEPLGGIVFRGAGDPVLVLVREGRSVECRRRPRAGYPAAGSGHDQQCTTLPALREPAQRWRQRRVHLRASSGAEVVVSAPATPGG